MGKQGRLRLFALMALVFATIYLSSCIFGGSGKSKEECIEDYKENYLPELLDHFTKNEEIYNKLAESLSDYVIGVDDIESYRSLSLSEDYYAEKDEGDGIKYKLTIIQQLNPDDEKDRTRVDLDFVSDSAINKFNLTENDLDIVFSRYRRVFCDSLSDVEYRGGSIGFEDKFAAMYNRADRVDTTLWYRKSGGKPDSPESINDHWYFIYSLYWSPAI